MISRGRGTNRANFGNRAGICFLGTMRTPVRWITRSMPRKSLRTPLYRTSPAKPAPTARKPATSYPTTHRNRFSCTRRRRKESGKSWIFLETQGDRSRCSLIRRIAVFRIWGRILPLFCIRRIMGRLSTVRVRAGLSLSASTS